MLSGNAIVSSLFGLVGSTAFRLIYNATLDSHANTVILVNAGLYFMVAIGNVIIFVNRKLFLKYAKFVNEEEEEERNRKISSSSSFSDSKNTSIN